MAHLGILACGFNAATGVEEAQAIDTGAHPLSEVASTRVRKAVTGGMVDVVWRGIRGGVGGNGFDLRVIEIWEQIRRSRAGLSRAMFIEAQANSNYDNHREAEPSSKRDWKLGPDGIL